MNFLIVNDAWIQNENFLLEHTNEALLLNNYLGNVVSKFREMNYKIIHNPSSTASYYEGTKSRKKTKKVLKNCDSLINYSYDKTKLKQDDERIKINFKKDLITNHNNELIPVLKYFKPERIIITGYHLQACIYTLVLDLLEENFEPEKIKIAANCVLPLRNYDTYNFDHYLKDFEHLGIEIVHI